MARRRWVMGAGIAAALAGGAALGFVAASLIVAGPQSLNERSPFAAARSLVGRAVGRAADAPQEIPLAGWWAIVKRSALLVARNRLMAESASVTFYTLLALFPALAATVSLYGLFADPSAIARLIDLMAVIVPTGGLDILRRQLHDLIAHGPRGLTAGVAISLAVTLWSANQGSKALFEALNVIYREVERRSYVRFVLVSMAFTFSAIVFVIAAMIAVVLLPEVLHALGLSTETQGLLRIVRWPVILVVVAFFLSCLYRFGPCREDPKWRWVTWGGGLAAVSWVAVSFGFSWYVQSFGSFDRTYGSLGAVVGFMTWIWLSTLVALCGAQLNAEMEHQTALDTTTGPPVPLGFRGATQANTVA